MNLKPLVLSVSLFAGTASAAIAQQSAPQQFDDNDLGLTPAQMADFAGRPEVITAAAPGELTPVAAQALQAPGSLAGTGSGFGTPVPILRPAAYSPTAVPYGFAGPQTLLMGYQAPGGPIAPQTARPPATSQQMSAAPSGPSSPNWPSGNVPQQMLQGPPGQYGPSPDWCPYAPDGFPPGPAPGVEAYPGGCGNGIAAGCNPPRPCWYFRGDSVWLTRSHADYHNLTSYNNLNNANDRLNFHFLLNTDDVTYPLEPGMRLTFGRYVTDTWMVEGTYYGAVSWDRRNGTPNFPTGANGLGPLLSYWGPGFGAFDTGAFTGSNVQTASYESQFNSGELNVRHAVWGTTTILGGIRYLNVGDFFQLAASDNANNTNSNGSGFYRTWTNNNLVGVQLGTEYTHDLWFPRLFGSIDCRGGIYANFDEQKNLLFNSGDSYNQRSDRHVQFASVWDLTFALSYLATDHLTIRGGYTFLYIDGIALAPNQLDTNPTMLSSRKFIADNDTLTLQGPFVGGELVW
jgi:hypothetical protein